MRRSLPCVTPRQCPAQTAQLDPRLRLGQTEAYVEYGRDGRVVKGVDKAPTRTKYEEDVYVNNHTSVWGSYYRYDSTRASV